MKKSNNPSIRIKRALKEVTDASNKYNLGGVIFEELILKGIRQAKIELEAIDRTKNHFINPKCFEEVIEIIEKHIEP